MNNQLNEYINAPKWIDTLTPEEAHEWYLIVKRDLPLFKSRGDTAVLEQAIVDYEKRHDIK